MNEERGPCNPLDFGCTSRMIEVPVGKKDTTDPEPMTGYLLDDFQDITPGIDDQSLPGFLAAQDVTIGLIGADNQFPQHGFGVRPFVKSC